MTKKTKGKSSKEEEVGAGAGSFLNGLVDLIEKLGDLAEKGKEIKGTGEISDLGLGKQLKGVYGFNVKVGLGQEKVKVEPFGNIVRDKKSGHAVVQEVREPMVDLFEESDHLLIVAEMPGIGPGDVELDVKEDVLTLDAVKGDKKYHKELLLPQAFSRQKMEVSCNNGMVEIRCFK